MGEEAPTEREMKTRRKHRQRLIPLDFARPANVVSHERGKAMLAKVIETLESRFAARGKTSSENS